MFTLLGDNKINCSGCGREKDTRVKDCLECIYRNCTCPDWCLMGVPIDACCNGSECNCNARG